MPRTAAWVLSSVSLSAFCLCLLSGREALGVLGDMLAVAGNDGVG
jgi:hypothetical protein